VPPWTVVPLEPPEMGAACGTVYLVGAGPGHPELITVCGLDLLRHADVVVYDRLVASELLCHARRDAERIDVGKSPGEHSVSQEEINRILVDRARSGRSVVRLKGGDPFVFGRGFEELSACRGAGVPCVVIPGVSSAFAVPAAAGIPVTLREHVRSVAVITGSVSSEAAPLPLNYQALASIDTLVVLMGLEPLAALTQSLIKAGRDPNTPAATIQRGTLPDQRVVCGTLATLADAVSDAGLQAPVITVIGEVAGYAEQSPGGTSPGRFGQALQHGESLRTTSTLAIHSSGLIGMRVVLTRPPSRSRKLRRTLERAGAVVIECPMIEIRFPDHAAEADEAIQRLNEYSWIVFTSANGVRGFWRRVRAAGLDARAVGHCKIAVVGPATARALRHIGLRADLMPEQPNAVALVEEMAHSRSDRSGRLKPMIQGETIAANARSEELVLFPCGNRALNTLAEGLARHGFQIERAVVYETFDVDVDARCLRRLADDADLVVFHSPSAVRQYARLGGPTSLGAVCIGQTTASAARERGFTSLVVAESADISGLVATVQSLVRSG
jgi:uroporphyrinogen III methyltransferase / synthase